MVGQVHMLRWCVTWQLTWHCVVVSDDKDDGMVLSCVDMWRDDMCGSRVIEACGNV